MASQGKILEGSVPVSRLTRFREMLARQSGDVHLQLAFSRGAQNRTHLSGILNTTVDLICQNCLAPFSLSLDCDIRFVIVENEADLNELEEGVEGFLADGREVRLAELIEDELILAVPMIPRHIDEECPGNNYQQDADEVPAETETTHRPFADLAEAMKKQDKAES